MRATTYSKALTAASRAASLALCFTTTRTLWGECSNQHQCQHPEESVGTQVWVHTLDSSWRNTASRCAHL
jgi:hypothetical protein